MIYTVFFTKFKKPPLKYKSYVWAVKTNAESKAHAFAKLSRVLKLHINEVILVTDKVSRTQDIHLALARFNQLHNSK